MIIKFRFCILTDRPRNRKLNRFITLLFFLLKLKNNLWAILLANTKHRTLKCINSRYYCPNNEISASREFNSYYIKFKYFRLKSEHK